MNDLRFAIRSLCRNPGFASVTILTLALGIGATVAIFTVVNAVLLQPLPYPDSARLIAIAQLHARSGPEFASLPDYNDWREGNTTLQSIGGAWGATFNLTDIDEPERLRGALITESLLPTLATPPVVGRVFSSSEPDPRIVVLSHPLWQRRFGGDREVVGRKVMLNGRSHTVVGVMPAGFAFPEATTELWVPLIPETGMNRGYHLLSVVGRLKREATIEEARAELETIAARAAVAYPDFNKDWSVLVQRLQDAVVGTTDRALWILAAAVGCLLLIACANVASVLLSRVATRRQEISVRAALGASRLRLVRQLLAESVLLAVCGGALGFALAAAAIASLLTLATLPRSGEVSLDVNVMMFTVAISALAVVFFGLMPAVAGSRTNLQQSLTTRGSSRGSVLRPTLLAFQVAAAVVLLAGAGLLMHSFHRLLQVETGFSVDRVLTVRFFLPRAAYPVERCVQLYQQMIERARSLPGVEAAAAVSVFPLSGVNANVPLEILGRPPVAASDRAGADFVTATPDYFRTMSIPLIVGREFGSADRAESPFVAIISQSMADQFFPNQDPIGQSVRVMGPKPRTIVGVVGNTRQRALHSPPAPEIYIPHTQFPAGGMFLVVRAQSDAAQLSNQLRSELRGLDGNLPIAAMRTGEEVLDTTLSSRRFSLILLTVFAASALGLAAVGVFGMMSFTVAQRTKEIGIRMALGASSSGMLRRTIWQGLVPVIAGAVVGVAAARAAVQLLDTMLFGTQPSDPATFAGVIVTLLVVATAAAWIPARRAARVDPAVALRYE